MLSTIKIQFRNGRPVIEVIHPRWPSDDARDTLIQAFKEGIGHNGNTVKYIPIEHTDQNLSAFLLEPVYDLMVPSEK